MRSFLVLTLALGAACMSRAARPQEPAALAGDLEPRCDALVRFATDSAELSTDAKWALGEVAECLKRDRDARVRVEGHADRRGDSDYNLSLAAARAARVRSYLEQLGATRDQVVAITEGELEPVCRSDDPRCLRRNRVARVFVER